MIPTPIRDSLYNLWHIQAFFLGIKKRIFHPLKHPITRDLNPIIF